jgi:beta-glucosidase
LQKLDKYLQNPDIPIGAMVRRHLFATVAVIGALIGGLLGAMPATAAPRPWKNAALAPEDRANALLARMTLAEKITMMHQGAACDYGGVIGAEGWGKGANTVLGPTINIDRDPRWGRSFESLSEDPYLAAQLGAAEIQGIQGQGPMAQVKHYAVYNQETYRNTAQDNAVVAERTEREIYLPAFEAAIKQGKADSAMCSYASVNGTFACENGRLQNTILKQQWGSPGSSPLTGAAPTPRWPRPTTAWTRR